MKPIALVLGGGGARGLCFLGVLKCLHEEDIPIDHIVGTSMGAIIGAAFCAGSSIIGLIEAASSWRARYFVSLDVFGPSILSHQPLRRMVEAFVPARRFEDLEIPLTVVCTDIFTGERVVFTRGELIPAVVASSLAAGLFSPVRHAGRFLVDGGYSDPVPAQLCPSGSLRLVVDPSVLPTRPVRMMASPSIRNFWKFGSVISQAIKGIDIALYNFAAERNRECSGVFIVPDLGTRSFCDFRRPFDVIQAGEDAMRAKLQELRDILSCP